MSFVASLLRMTGHCGKDCLGRGVWDRVIFAGAVADRAGVGLSAQFQHKAGEGKGVITIRTRLCGEWVTTALTSIVRLTSLETPL